MEKTSLPEKAANYAFSIIWCPGVIIEHHLISSPVAKVTLTWEERCFYLFIYFNVT